MRPRGRSPGHIGAPASVPRQPEPASGPRQRGATQQRAGQLPRRPRVVDCRAEHLPQHGQIAGDDRNSRGDGLERSQAEPFLDGGERTEPLPPRTRLRAIC